jgi:hypothetical protein
MKGYCRAEGECAARLIARKNANRLLRPKGPSVNELPIGHFLRHVQNELAVFIFNFAEKTTQFVEETGFFPNASPGDIVRRFALGKIGQLGWLFSVVEELIEWALESASQFLKRFDGRNGMAIFNTRDIAAK